MGAKTCSTENCHIMPGKTVLIKSNSLKASHGATMCAMSAWKSPAEKAPYLTSRYDTTTAESIPLPHRIGILDRKLRIVSENTTTSEDWLKWAQEAFKSLLCLRMARRQPADCPRKYAVYVHRLLQRKIRKNASNEVASLHRLYRFMESLANGRT